MMNYWRYVGEVSPIFDFFQPIFAQGGVSNLKIVLQMQLDELYRKAFAAGQYLTFCYNTRRSFLSVAGV